VVIDDFNIHGARRSVGPFKTYPPLVIDADAVLASPVAFQCLKSVARQGSKIPDSRGRFQAIKLQAGGAFEARKRPDPFAGRADYALRQA
jgi:hypothetical protein